MIRCVVRPEQIRRDCLVLDRRQARHLVGALRLRPGDEFLAVSGRLPPRVAVVESLGRGQVTARLRAPAAVPPPEPWAVTVAAAIPHRAGAFDRIVDQATQLGAAAIIPMVTARTVVRLEATRAAARQRRWTQLAVEAAQQSGRDTVPPVQPVTAFEAVVRAAASYDLVLLPMPSAEAGPLAPWLRQHRPRRVLILVGPEGGLAPEEAARASAAGARWISLGPQTLRCETAAPLAVGVLLYALREAAASA